MRQRGEVAILQMTCEEVPLAFEGTDASYPLPVSLAS